jgi:NADH-quinone oxidoreductase subunit L
MPITAGTFIVGWLAIAGVPPFAGFWAKDEMLLYTLADDGSSSTILYAIGLITAILTAFYMTRQVVLVFFGEARWDSLANADEAPEGEEEHASTAHGEFKPHESPTIMLIPLVVLAFFAAFGGLIQLPAFSFVPDNWQHKLETWLHPVVEIGEAHITESTAYEYQGWLAVVATACALTGIALGIAIYAKHKAKPVEPEILEEGWKYDWAITWFMGGPGRAMFAALAWFDTHVIDGAVNGAARLVVIGSGGLRRIQTGNVRNYAAIIGVGVVFVLAWFIIGRGVI